jgi:hypothetical protein
VVAGAGDKRMRASERDNSTETLPVSRGMLWFALLGGGVAWAVHLGGAWAISEFGCVAGIQRSLLLGVSVVAWAIVAVSVMAFAVAVAATVVGWRRENRLELRDPADRVDGSAMYMCRAGWITSGIFAFIILVQSVPIFFYLGDC